MNGGFEGVQRVCKLLRSIALEDDVLMVGFNNGGNYGLEIIVGQDVDEKKLHFISYLYLFYRVSHSLLSLKFLTCAILKYRSFQRF